MAVLYHDFCFGCRGIFVEVTGQDILPKRFSLRLKAGIKYNNRFLVLVKEKMLVDGVFLGCVSDAPGEKSTAFASKTLASLIEILILLSAYTQLQIRSSNYLLLHLSLPLEQLMRRLSATNTLQLSPFLSNCRFSHSHSMLATINRPIQSFPLACTREDVDF